MALALPFCIPLVGSPRLPSACLCGCPQAYMRSAGMFRCCIISSRCGVKCKAVKRAERVALRPAAGRLRHLRSLAPMGPPPRPPCCSKDTLEDIRLGALECMAALYYAQGRSLSIGVQETVAVAAKYCAAK